MGAFRLAGGLAALARVGARRLWVPLVWERSAITPAANTAVEISSSATSVSRRPRGQGHVVEKRAVKLLLVLTSALPRVHTTIPWVPSRSWRHRAESPRA